MNDKKLYKGQAGVILNGDEIDFFTAYYKEAGDSKIYHNIVALSEDEKYIDILIAAIDRPSDWVSVDVVRELYTTLEWLKHTKRLVAVDDDAMKAIDAVTYKAWKAIEALPSAPEQAE